MIDGVWFDLLDWADWIYPDFIVLASNRIFRSTISIKTGFYMMDSIFQYLSPNVVGDTVDSKHKTRITIIMG